jgi:hypothetical protein
VAVLAAARAVEVSLAGLGVAGDYVETLVNAAIGHQFHLHVKELGDVVELVFGEVGESGHALVGTALGDDGADEFAFFIVQNGLRSGPGSGRTAPRALSP